MTYFVWTLSNLLHEEQFPTANARFAVAAVYKDPGPPAALTVLWSRAEVLSGTTSPLTSCAPANQTNEIQLETPPVTLPTGFTMAPWRIAKSSSSRRSASNGQSRLFPDRRTPTTLYPHATMPWQRG